MARGPWTDGPRVVPARRCQRRNRCKTIGRRWCTVAVLAVAFATPAMVRAVPSRPQRACILSGATALRSVARAQRAEVVRCLAAAAGGDLAPGQTAEQCVAADARGRVARATARAAQREGAKCTQTPDFGWVPGAAPPAAVAAEQGFAHAVLGAPLDVAVPTGRAAARCQLLALRAAGGCADRFLSADRTCSARALLGAADDSRLVWCKGADPAGAIAKACRTDLSTVVARACAGQDLAALFPGCAGQPLVPCLAGQAKAHASRALDAAGGLCAPPGPPPPGPEPIDLSFVPLPAGVASVQLPWWTADGSRLVFSVRFAGGTEWELATIAPDGSDFRCVTCAIATPGHQPFLKPIPFADGTRVLLRVGNQTPFTTGDHAVLECSPSLLDCQSPVLVPIVVPATSDPAVVEDQREFRLAPDGGHVGFTQVRNDTDGQFTFVSIVGELVRAADHYDVLDPHAVSTLGELKQFAHDQQSVIVAAFATNPFGAVNPDAVRVSLADGTVSRVTTHPDYDEPVEFSPDDAWFAVGSGRGGHFFDVFSQVPRPALVNPALESTFLYFFLGQRDPLLEPWLVDRWGARGDYIGQQLNPSSRAEGYDGRMIMNWSPDGTRLVYWEALTDTTGLPPDAADSRLVIAHLSSRAPVLAPVLPQPVPSLAWACQRASGSA
jgi:hypothetical protein